MKRITAEDGTMTAELTNHEWTKLIDARKICNELAFIEGSSHEGAGEATTERGDHAVTALPELAAIIATRPT